MVVNFSSRQELVNHLTNLGLVEGEDYDLYEEQ